ncbi:sensor histidine kinase [Paenibacillus silvae]|uniref:sensor histidine kinase n=1 Tax=Paenibacillus silvae TaxID=1325358 RepID=UPI0011A9432C|nr:MULTISPECIES: HAMP domain-containing sensor histidine kinase [Paenibacillus]MCK6074744.1 HAMP domain-containing histidine kinase [Paenibacillus silvae]MCK6147781.1 HAMP domain-containing histidine kinase [Paenibacillus silvae]MCK6266079.1 HAMP domain-containing histidine kinase [Paenibacillus silvae]
MSIRRKLLTRFIVMLTGTVILIILLGSLATIWVLQKVNEVNIVDDFAINGLDQLINSAEIMPDNTIRYDPELLKQVDKNQGWLQVLDEKGYVIDDYHVPSDVPDHYKPGELIAYSQGDKVFPYQLSMLIREKDGKYFTLLYGEKNVAQSLLDEIRPQLSYASGKLTVKPAEQETIRKADAYIQILDPYGKEIDSYNKPAVGVPSQYSIQDLILQVRYPNRSGISVATWYDNQNETTWMVSVRIDSTVVEKQNPYAFILEPALVVLILSIVALLILLALWYANRFGAPMLHMLQWLQRLEQGQYEEPTGASGIPRSQRRNGKWKRKYQVYGEVLHSMQALSHTLKQNEEQRKQTDSLREEWIAGITHDLKTPLSSIQGYAHMLETDKYSWTTEEVREFAGIMIDKSMYMDRLVNDLAMTYRLRSGGYQPEVKRSDVNALLCDLVQRAERNPAYGEKRILFQPADKPVYGLVHIPSFERIVDNLTANALLHNPPEATLVVRVLNGERDGEFTIEFADNGQGMSPEMVWKLFERYYRGTDTGTSDIGSGLGMAVTKGLIEAMKGRIEVRSVPGEGTTIRLIWDS